MRRTQRTIRDQQQVAAAPYLVALRLVGKKVVVVGGGEIGTAKIETLLTARPAIVVIDPSPSRRVLELAETGELELRTRRFCPLDLIGARLVVAATGDSRTNRRIRLWSQLTRALVNAVDDPPNCDVTIPAVVRRGPATIAISTGGSTPAGARFLREELSAAIDDVLPMGCGHVLEGAGEVRRQLRREGTYRFAYRSWRESFFEPAFSALRSGQQDRLQAIARDFVSNERRQAPFTTVGSVALVGAGPAGKDLITIRGARALAGADLVVYDRLADPALLTFAPVAAERIPVGKGKGFGHTQHQINALLIERAMRGDRVVRLKGGDPFVFGRGGEEHTALVTAGIEVEVIPGVSSAVAAAALVGIPLTDRRCASSFTVLTGHEVSTKPQWTHDQRNGTLVVLMAASTAAEVARSLLSAGRSPEQAVAFVHHAGSSNEATFITQLDDVAANGCPFVSPTVMIAGDVVRHRQPLAGQPQANSDPRRSPTTAVPSR